jgi:hypothetical protein
MMTLLWLSFWSITAMILAIVAGIAWVTYKFGGWDE